MRADLVDSMGSDLTIVNAARVSFDKESEWDAAWAEDYDGLYQYDILSDKDQKLVKYLATHGHFTPFTHAVITLRETVPIFVARQRFKHTVGFSYNETSRRYVDDEPEFFFPDVWRKRPDGSVKQGSGGDAPNQEYYQEYYTRLIAFCEECYRQMIADGVAPEQARMVLPQSMYTSYYVTGSLAAFARAYSLRADAHAQKEIQDLAEQWNNIIRPLYPISWEALTS